jgi:hypothetical protein
VASTARSAGDHRYRPRHIDVGDGTGLRLRADGTIDHVDAAGETVGSWQADDPDWARYALRFGLRPQPETVAPHGGSNGGSKPPPR